MSYKPEKVLVDSVWPECLKKYYERALSSESERPVKLDKSFIDDSDQQKPYWFAFTFALNTPAPLIISGCRATDDHAFILQELNGSTSSATPEIYGEVPAFNRIDEILPEHPNGAVIVDRMWWNLDEIVTRHHRIKPSVAMQASIDTLKHAGRMIFPEASMLCGIVRHQKRATLIKQYRSLNYVIHGSCKYCIASIDWKHWIITAPLC